MTGPRVPKGIRMNDNYFLQLMHVAACAEHRELSRAICRAHSACTGSSSHTFRISRRIAVFSSCSSQHISGNTPSTQAASSGPDMRSIPAVTEQALHVTPKHRATLHQQSVARLHAQGSERLPIVCPSRHSTARRIVTRAGLSPGALVRTEIAHKERGEKQ